jgi:leucyl/phenylalanyl-tRNA---protein transferase
MPLFTLGKELIFPPVEMSEPDGLLAVGGDLSENRILLAYRQGIFPWYEGDHILWWSPDPRFVLFPDHLRITKSMQQLFKKNFFQFTFNTAFEQVIAECKTIDRKGQDRTWITAEMKSAYIRLHRLGYAQSAEAWKDGELVGGLYGIRLGKVFCGESMFNRVSNASKFAFISLVEHLKLEGLRIVDCQVYTAHLESLGAEMIPRQKFIQILKESTKND